MMMESMLLKEQFMQEVDKLSSEQQSQLLDIARHLQRSSLLPGTSGEVFLEVLDKLTFAPGAVDEMMRAIEEGCERVDWDG